MNKLNLGCGTKLKDGFINIDIRDIPRVLKYDVRNLPFELGTIDRIEAIDVLEHIEQGDMKRTFLYWIDLLRPGGTLFVQTTCLNQIVELFSRYDWDKELLCQRIFGGQTYPENYHKSIGEISAFKEWLFEVGIPKENYRITTNFGNHTNMRIEVTKP